MHTRKSFPTLTLGLLALTTGLSFAGSLALTGTKSAQALSEAPAQSTTFTALAARLDAEDAKLAAQQAAIQSLKSTVRTLKSTAKSQAAIVQALRQANTTLTARIATVQSRAQLTPTTNTTTYGPFTVTGTDVYLNGYNLHIQNGAGKTGSANGLGNLIIGYNEVRTGITHTGSHNLVVGQYQTYTSYGGIVSGYDNSITGAWASAIGGDANVASGTCSSVTGGFKNSASGNYSSVVGGQSDTASAQFGLEPVSTSLAGLQTQLTNQNKITSRFSLSNGVGTNTELTLTGVNLHVVNGQGSTNTQNGLGNLIVGYNELRSSISGSADVRTGSHNIVTGIYNNFSSYGSIVGGYFDSIGAYAFCIGSYNTASATFSSVSGGESNNATGTASSVSGGIYNAASGDYASASGGLGRSVPTEYGWKAGSQGMGNSSSNFSSP